MFQSTLAVVFPPGGRLAPYNEKRKKCALDTLKNHFIFRVDDNNYLPKTMFKTVNRSVMIRITDLDCLMNKRVEYNYLSNAYH